MRKITSFLLALVIVFALGAPVYAAGDPVIGVRSATVAAGETANIEVYIENNPGVAGLSLKLAYDKTVLTAGDASNGAVFPALTQGFISTGTKLVLDNSDNVTGNGVLATVPFTVAADAAPGEYAITLSILGAVDKNADDVAFASVSAIITVPAPAAPTIGIADATIEAGQTADVDVCIDANPGIAGLTLKLTYDKSIFTIGEAVKGPVFPALTQGTISTGTKLVFDNSDNVTADGVLATLPITVAAGAAAGDYAITLTILGAVDKNADDVAFDAVSATITVTVPAPATPTIGVEDATIEAGKTADVAVNIENNPGIAGLTLKLTYDKSVFTIGEAVNGAVFPALTQGTISTGTKLVLDNSDNVTADGVLATLPITVAAGTAAGDYPITLSILGAVDKNADDVAFDAVSATITVTEAVIPEITFTAANVTVDAANIESFRDGEGFVVPVAITASDIPAANGVAAFTIKVDGDADIEAIEPGAAIVDAERFTVGPNNDIVWVDVNDITAADAEIAIVNIYVDHVVAADSVFNVTLASSGDPDDYLFFDLTNYTPVFVNGSVTFEVGADHIAADAVIENNVEPDCTNDGGYDTVVYCAICGDELSRVHTDVPSPGHTAGDAVIENNVEPDCTNDGGYDTVVYCSVCGEEISRVHTDVPSPGHTAGDAVIENEVPATCTTAGGYDTVVYCSVCGEEISRVHTDTPLAAHTLTHFDRVEAQVGVEGNIEYWYCSVCDKYFSDEGVTEIAAADLVIPALAQIPGDVDGDGNINAIDVRIIMKVLAGWTADQDPELANYDPLIADFNGDGKVNNRDILAMLKWIVANA